MINYYYISQDVLVAFPDLKVSNPFKGPGGITAYVAIIPDFRTIISYYDNFPNKSPFFAYKIEDSQVDLEFTEYDFDEEDNEIQTTNMLTKEYCNDYGLVRAIELCLGLSKEENVAYAIHKLSVEYEQTPIEFVNSLEFQN